MGPRSSLISPARRRSCGSLLVPRRYSARRNSRVDREVPHKYYPEIELTEPVPRSCPASSRRPAVSQRRFRDQLSPRLRRRQASSTKCWPWSWGLPTRRQRARLLGALRRCFLRTTRRLERGVGHSPADGAMHRPAPRWVPGSPCRLPVPRSARCRQSRPHPPRCSDRESPRSHRRLPVLARDVRHVVAARRGPRKDRRSSARTGARSTFSTARLPRPTCPPGCSPRLPPEPASASA